MTETAAATNGEKGDTSSTEIGGKSPSDMVFDEGGSGDNPKIKSQSLCKDNAPCKASVSDGQMNDDAVTSVITSLHQLALSAEQLGNTKGVALSTPSTENEASNSSVANVASGIKESTNAPVVQVASSQATLQQLQTVLNGTGPAQQKRAITGQQVNVSVVNGPQSMLTASKVQNFNNINGMQAQLQQPVRWQNGNLVQVQQQQLAQCNMINNSVSFSRQKRNLPGVPPTLNGQMTRPFVNAQNGTGMSAINASGSTAMTAATAASTQATSARRQNLISAQYLQAALNAKALGLDDTANLLALQDRINGSGDNLGVRQTDVQLYEFLQKPETRVSPHEQLKGRRIKRRGKSPFGLIDLSALQEGASQMPIEDMSGIDQSLTPQQLASGSAQQTQQQMSPGTHLAGFERYSRKVFVGGLPPDIDEDEITTAFRRFGPLVVDWPHKAESKSYFPPKGYCFLIFQDEMSVHNLTSSCFMDDNKLYWCVSSPTMKDKPVQIRPWSLGDSDFVMDGSQALDPRKTIFVGGVPRPLKAVELAMIMDRLYGCVCYAGIDTDPELKYPKGAGRVAFSSQQSYIAAISARFVQLQHADIDKRVEVKPYVLDDQLCDECQGARCGGKFAPFFCANITCLQYYCETCWSQIHAHPGREFHKPLVKEGADRPRTVPFRWC